MFDTMTLTKIVGGFCGMLLLFLMGKWAAETIYHAGGHGDEHAQAYVIETGEDDDGEAEAEEGPSFAELFVNADVGKGERVFNKCKACHKLEEGANGTGPYLYGVVGRDVASANGFSYSGNLAPAADVWTPQNLQHFLENPAGFAPGTTMGFAGLKNIEDRANLIAFLDQTDGDTYEIEMPADEEAAATDGEEATDEAAAEGDAAGEETAADAGDASDAEMAADEGETSNEEMASDEGDASGDEMAQDTDGMDAAEQMSPEQPEVAEVQPTPQAEADAENVTDEEVAGDAAEDESAEAADAGTEEATAETASDEQQPAAEDGEQSGFGAMVAAADPAEGEKVFRKCKACHVADKEQNRVGPHLVGLVGRPVASVDDFRYSDAMQDFGGEWSYDRLDTFLTDPKGTVSGTKMSFAGLKKEEDRASVVAYLESLN